MTAKYNAIGDSYRRFKETAALCGPERAHVTALLGDVRSERVLDLGCGYGYYTQQIHTLGAAHVFGVDVSPEMIRLARQSPPDASTGIHFQVGDAEDSTVIGEFETVVAVWLFNYADSVNSLHNMMTTVAGHLAPGGRLVAITVHPAFDPGKQDWEEYGLRTDSYTELSDRRRFQSSLLTPETAIPIEHSQWNAATYAHAARDVGLSDLQWSVPAIPETELLKRGAGFWDAFRSNPFIAGFTTRSSPTARF
ncbi:class I SAM-dependent methyltransferase [Streptomyces sp. NPDC127068]|uniref:class I SAM-dependent methyltransferase n=1 Tax=Streptomyces sp. NPDC127068 TaxID=3347127 RepID=UPI003654EC54